MKIKLRYGYRDIEDVEEEHNRILKSTRNLHTELWEDEETGEVFASIYSPWRFEIKRYVELWLPEFKEMADSIIDENIVQP